MRVIPHLSFDGQCEAAFRLYEECFGGKIALMLTYGSQRIPSLPPELEDKVFHATLKIGDQTITGVDVAHSAYEKPQGFAVQLNIDDVDQATRIYNALTPGGKVLVEMQKTSWSGHYAALTDRFGVPWEINCEA
jgi:PhnB protein